jgi:hypothetical protein
MVQIIESKQEYLKTGFERYSGMIFNNFTGIEARVVYELI